MYKQNPQFFIIGQLISKHQKNKKFEKCCFMTGMLFSAVFVQTGSTIKAFSEIRKLQKIRPH